MIVILHMIYGSNNNNGMDGALIHILDEGRALRFKFMDHLSSTLIRYIKKIHVCFISVQFLLKPTLFAETSQIDNCWNHMQSATLDYATLAV